MGSHYNYGTFDAATSEKLLDAIEQKINTIEPSNDGTVEVEILIKGKTVERVTLPQQSLQELKSTMKFHFPD